jgi:hypothetical protein
MASSSVQTSSWLSSWTRRQGFVMPLMILIVVAFTSLANADAESSQGLLAAAEDENDNQILEHSLSHGQLC